jgi:hypothetical protein
VLCWKWAPLEVFFEETLRRYDEEGTLEVFRGDTQQVFFYWSATAERD